MTVALYPAYTLWVSHSNTMTSARHGPVILKIYISRTFQKLGKFGVLVPVTEAMRYWARSVSHCESPQPWLAKKVGSPSTCSS